MQYKFTSIIICALLISAKPAGFKTENKELTKCYVYVPGKDATHAGFYISSIEVTNKQYREFLNDLHTTGQTEKLEKAMVDTAKWRTALHSNEPYVAYYFQHKAYDNYPVVNVSKEGAMLYCAWLTEKYNAGAKTKVRFQLPSEAQWMQAAQGGDATAVYPWKGNALTYDKPGKWHNSNMCNYKHSIAPAGATNTNNENADITAPSLSFMPNAYGIYNMSGNVAELVADKSYTKGGSWSSPADKLTIAAREDYGTAVNTPTVGFRPIMINLRDK